MFVRSYEMSVSTFAKRTGDFNSLSMPDIRVMALTYMLEVERNGLTNIKQLPHIIAPRHVSKAKPSLATPSNVSICLMSVLLLFSIVLLVLRGCVLFDYYFGSHTWPAYYSCFVIAALLFVVCFYCLLFIVYCLLFLFDFQSVYVSHLTICLLLCDILF